MSHIVEPPAANRAPHEPVVEPARQSSKTGRVAAAFGWIGTISVLLAAAWVASIWNDPDYATAGLAVLAVVVAVALLSLVPGGIAILLSLVALRRPGRDRAARWGLGLGVLAVAPAVLLIALVFVQ